MDKPTFSFMTPCAFGRLMLLVFGSLLSVSLCAQELLEAIKSGESVKVAAAINLHPELEKRDSKGNTALHWAARLGRADWIHVLLKGGAMVDAKNDVDATPLIYAVHDLECVRILVESGADLNHVTQHKTSCLSAAARFSDSSEVVEWLLSKGVDKTFLNDAIRSAASAGDAKTFKVLLRAGAQAHGLIGASSVGSLEIVQAILESGVDPNENINFVGHALNWSLFARNLEVARLLIQHGADLNIRSPAGEHHTPPILWAAYGDDGDDSVAKWMIEKGVEVNQQSALGETALDWAIARNNQSLVDILKKAGATEGTSVKKQKRIPERILPEDSTQLNLLIRESAERSVKLLQHTSDGFLNSGIVQKQKCVSCHQQTLPAITFALALERGIPVDKKSLARQIQDQIRYWSKGSKIEKAYEMIRPQPDTSVLVGYGLDGLAALGFRSSELTDAMVWYLAGTQLQDGSWPTNGLRPPMEDGPVQGTAYAIRAMQLYPLAGQVEKMRDSIQRAKAYLETAPIHSFNQRVYRLLGLGWGGESVDSLKVHMDDIVSLQNKDGGWSQLEGLPSDAWATGQALVALNTVGGLGVKHPVFQRGLQFLLRTQFEDGSWYVRSRSWPFQPHFESGFPHGKDQWISAGGTAWATMALLLTQPKITSASLIDWVALDVSSQRHDTDQSIESNKIASVGSRTVHFERDIQPLLERSCVDCHSGGRPKGKFRVDSYEWLMKGGQSAEPVILPGSPESSPLLKFVKQEVEDLEMPPLSKRDRFPELSPKEIKTIETWIKEGASEK